MSSAAEEVALCRVGRRLRRLSALNQEDVDREVHPKSGCPLSPGEHAERPGYDRRYKGRLPANGPCRDCGGSVKGKTRLCDILKSWNQLCRCWTKK